MDSKPNRPMPLWGRLLVVGVVLTGGVATGVWRARAEDKKPTARSPEPTKYTYRGREVNQKWFEDRYAEFADKIVIVDGKPVLVWKSLIEGDLIPSNPPEPGTVLWAIGTVFQGGEGHALVEVITPENDRLTVHIAGLGKGALTEGADYRAAVIYRGTYSYKDVAGAKRTIQEYTPLIPLTRTQFADALAGGLKLVRYEKVKKRVPGAVVNRIVETPIP